MSFLVSPNPSVFSRPNPKIQQFATGQEWSFTDIHLRSIAAPDANALRRGGRDKPSVNKVREGKPQQAISQGKTYGIACVTEHDAENWRHG